MTHDLFALSRRDFLVGAAGAWISATLPRPLAAEAAARSASSSEPIALSPTEWEVVEAITARILPTDDTPGAREAGCVNFIDKALAAEDAEALPRYRAAIRELESACVRRFDKGFAALAPDEQDALLHALEEDRIEGWASEEASAAAFFATLRMHTLLGFLLSPQHGGNRDFVGWKTVGWPGPVHHLGGSQPDQMLGERAFVPIWERAPASGESE